MDIYLKILNKRKHKKIKKIFENYNIKQVFLDGLYYKINEKFIRKLKIKKLENSKEFKEITNIIYDKTLIRFADKKEIDNYNHFVVGNKKSNRYHKITGIAAIIILLLLIILKNI